MKNLKKKKSDGERKIKIIIESQTESLHKFVTINIKNIIENLDKNLTDEQ